MLRVASLLVVALIPPVTAQESPPLFVATPLTEAGSFTKGVEGPACDAQGNVYAVNFGAQQTIGKVTPAGKAEVFVTLPGKSVGNGIRCDARGIMFVADYVGHNVLRIDPATKVISVQARVSSASSDQRRSAFKSKG